MGIPGCVPIVFAGGRIRTVYAGVLEYPLLPAIRVPACLGRSGARVCPPSLRVLNTALIVGRLGTFFRP